VTARRRSGWRLGEAEVRGWLEDLVAAGVAVVAAAGEEKPIAFRSVESAAEVALISDKTRWSPKEHLLPRTEPLYSFTLSGDDVTVEDPVPDAAPTVLFGLRPCDAAGLAKLDDVFLVGPSDPLYAARREATTVVTLACTEAGPECFCTAVGGSPAGEAGGDVLLYGLSDGWVVRPVTAKGRELVRGPARGWSKAGEEAWREIDRGRRRVERQIRRPRLAKDVGPRLERHFAASRWQEYGARCLGCTLCATVCPSCSCFDVQQEGDLFGGVQFRCWDGCTLPRFTLHASGHNPRPDRAARFRQRVLHKFAYSEGDGGFRCVGCGRCVALCPAGLDVHEAAATMSRDAGEGSDGRV